MCLLGAIQTRSLDLELPLKTPRSEPDCPFAFNVHLLSWDQTSTALVDLNDMQKMLRAATQVLKELWPMAFQVTEMKVAAEADAGSGECDAGWTWIDVNILFRDLCNT